MFNWEYLWLNEKGQLVDEDGYVVDEDWPTFDSEEEAEKYLVEEDVRANCVGTQK